MPFVQRVIEPIYLSRQSLPREGEVLLTDYELEAVTNNTLSNALRQLASLVLIANDIFDDLAKQLQDVGERSNKLRTRIESVEEKVTAFDPKTVTVPESDICTFSLRTVHFAAGHGLTTGLFSAETRPTAVRCLYEAAAKTPVHAMRQMDRYRRDGHRSSRYFLCTPVLGNKRRRLRHRADIDIETRTPAAVVELRRWTSSEAFGDVTVAPDCASRIVVEEDAAADHRLPSPEEQVHAVALRFPGEVVSVDVSGRAFQRMTALRRSLLVGEADVRRRSSRRKPRSRRRNTIAGTDHRELRQAVAGESRDESDSVGPPEVLSMLDDIAVVRSASSDLLRLRTGKDDSPPDSKKSHFNSLKQWGKVKLKLIRSGSSDSGSKASTLVPPEEANIYETITSKGRKAELKNSQLPISTSSAAMSMAVKLRQRQARTQKEDALHSSSGNWSASSESGRASIGSENTATTHQPKSTTTLSSAATSSNSLNHHQAPSSSVCSRRKFLNTSTSSSVSEGTLTPDIIPDLAVPFVDDGETSSIYSCDTEGYYTSFHMDSGLKTLKEEEMSAPQTPLHSTTALSNSPGRSSTTLTTLTAENEYELFGKGSTSTTTSSAGTVCTTLMVGHNDSNLSLALAPAVPERKSSLERSSQRVVAMIHKQEASDSPDSGHNTSSSPVDSTNSPQGTLTGRSSEYEFSESDLEGVDRLERIRIKTTINSSRIPSMCVITPPPSDDEASLSHYVPSYKNKSTVPSSTTRDKNNLLETDFGLKNRHNLKLVMPQQDTENTQVYHTSQPRPVEKQISTDSDRSSENETVKPINPSRPPTSNMNSSSKKQAKSVYSSGLATVQTVERNSLKSGTASQTDSAKPSQQKSSLLPFNSMLDKVKGVLTYSGNKKTQILKTVEVSDKTLTSEEKPAVDPGDYVTIADVRGKGPSEQPMAESPHYSRPVRDAEYVSLNELPLSRASSPPGNPLASPSLSDSLERRRRQGARVTLDAEGKVVYSSDSLRRNKGAHTTFEPGPYVKEQTVTPTASPLPLHRIPKSNIRPVALSTQSKSIPTSSKATSPTSLSPAHNKPMSPTSPQLGKVIIRAGSKTAPMSRVASPTSIAMPVVASPSGRPMSPQSTRGAYVHMQTTDESQRRRCVSPGRTTPGASTTEEDEEGKSSYQMHPPRYISPPSVQLQPHSSACNGQVSPSSRQEPAAAYYTLPARWTQESRSVAHMQTTQQVHGTGSGRFNTIASGGTWNQSNCAPYDARTQTNYANCAYKSSHTPSMSNHNVVQQNHQRPRENLISSYGQNRQYSHPMPAAIPTVPTVPKNNMAYMKQNNITRHGFHSSTPTKIELQSMNMSTNFSPIPKYSRKRDELGLQQTSSPSFQNTASSQHQSRNERKYHNDAVKRQETARLLSPPKSSMTAEELFAAIHKSKKKLNIKTDCDSYSRSGSPSCSSMTSLSPGSSESSINGGRIIAPTKNGPETGSLGGENVSRNRHSWSPNSNEYLDVHRALEHRTPSPVTLAGSRQSWACDRLGPIQQTSRNDFKRLLLQHGTKSNPISGQGSPGGKLSAVEQLKLTRQQKLATPPSSNIVNGGYLPRSPADKRTNGTKLLQSPRSASTWRFASPRTDVLSSTILEDCAEEEKASSSPQESIIQADTKLPSATGSSHGHTLTNAAVRRPLNLSFDDGANELLRKETLKQTEISSILQHYHRETSPKTKFQLIQKQSGSKTIIPEEKFVTNKSPMANNRAHSQDLLSPSNVKENVNTNQQMQNNSYINSPSKATVSTSHSPLMSNSQLASFKARQLFMQQPSALSNQQRMTLQPSSPIIQVSLDKQRSHFYNSHGSPGRSILGTIDTKSPSKSALETAL